MTNRTSALIVAGIAFVLGAICTLLLSSRLSSVPASSKSHADVKNSTITKTDAERQLLTLGQCSKGAQSGMVVLESGEQVAVERTFGFPTSWMQINVVTEHPYDPEKMLNAIYRSWQVFKIPEVTLSDDALIAAARKAVAKASSEVGTVSEPITAEPWVVAIQVNKQPVGFGGKPVGTIDITVP